MGKTIDLRNACEPISVDLVVGDEVNIKDILVDNSTTVNIPASLTEVTLMASNTLRKEVTIQNNSSSTMYVIRGGGATTTNYNWKLKIGDHLTIDDYRGNIKCIFASAIGFAMVSESYYT